MLLFLLLVVVLLQLLSLFEVMVPLLPLLLLVVSRALFVALLLSLPLFLVFLVSSLWFLWPHDSNSSVSGRIDILHVQATLPLLQTSPPLLPLSELIPPPSPLLQLLLSGPLSTHLKFLFAWFGATFIRFSYRLVTERTGEVASYYESA